ncbi:tyrosine-type recombinase/integrase [Spirillospora sp. NPDC048911]|uniref:tyrosine-type recombinase/integrase n=1 Tax=Spirillospora sp. NPDC048911 TaxID=3364527 RepID=UPI00371ABC75
MENLDRSLAPIDREDLLRLAELAADAEAELFRRNPRGSGRYSGRLLCRALCQGAALHYVNGSNGVKDFDVWSFYAEIDGWPFPPRWRGTRDFGPSKFGIQEIPRATRAGGFDSRHLHKIKWPLTCTGRLTAICVSRSWTHGGHTRLPGSRGETASHDPKWGTVATIDRRTSKSGKVTWRVRWRECGLSTGRTDSETCDSETDALNFAALVQLAGQRRPEGYPKGCRGHKLLAAEEPETVMPTFGKVLAEYLATLVDAEPRTLAEYRRAYESHIAPAMVVLPGGAVAGPLGRLPIDECVDADIWQAWVHHMRAKTYGKKTKRHYAPKTIINIHGTLIAPVFEYAIFRGYCGVNPCRWVKLPARKGRPIKAHHVLHTDEFQAWVDCAYAVDLDTGDVTALILGTGIRWGELTALRPCDVWIHRDDQGEITGGLLTIAQVVREDEHRRPYIATVEGKSENAFRTIAIGVDAAKILVARMASRKPKDLLFPAPGNRGGWLWRNANFHEHRWSKVKAIARQRGLSKDPSPHRLRHAHVTALIPLHGIESVSKRIGHANVTVTSAIYSHLVPDIDAGMATSLDGLLRPRRSAAPPDEGGT